MKFEQQGIVLDVNRSRILARCSCIERKAVQCAPPAGRHIRVLFLRGRRKLQTKPRDGSIDRAFGQVTVCGSDDLFDDPPISEKQLAISKWARETGHLFFDDAAVGMELARWPPVAYLLKSLFEPL
jgi:hypothetical protein